MQEKLLASPVGKSGRGGPGHLRYLAALSSRAYDGRRKKGPEGFLGLQVNLCQYPLYFACLVTSPD